MYLEGCSNRRDRLAAQPFGPEVFDVWDDTRTKTGTMPNWSNNQIPLCIPQVAPLSHVKSKKGGYGSGASLQHTVFHYEP